MNKPNLLLLLINKKKGVIFNLYAVCMYFNY